MNVLKTLIEKKAAALEAMKEAKTAANKSGEPVWTEELNSKFSKAERDFNEADKEMRLHEMEQEHLKAAEAVEERTIETAKAGKSTESREQIFVNWMRGGMSGLTPEQRSVLVESRGTSTQVTTTDSLGGYLVPDTWSSEIVKSMSYYGPMLQVSRIVPVSAGGTMHWPTSDQTSQKGAIVGQGVAGTVQDFSLGEKTISDFTYRSGVIKVALELIQDSAYPLDVEVREQIAERIGRILNEHFTTGDGSGKPAGIINDAATGKTSAANTTITWFELLDLVHSIDPAYRDKEKCAFQFTDTTLSVIRKFAVGSSDDRPIFLNSISLGESDRLFGYKYFVNNEMAEIGASAKPVVFGDWSKYIIKQVSAPVVQRYDERFMDALAVGYQGFARFGGLLVDAGAIKVLANPA